MCIVAWNWQPGSSTPLLLISNRDEYYTRATAALHWWSHDPAGNDVIAGKDLQAGGTWLGVSRTGRLAAITNFRSAEPLRNDTPSRGELVAGFLRGSMTAAHYLQDLSMQSDRYNPFNLLVFDGEQLLGLQSRKADVFFPGVGVGAVSNADFMTPWPKLKRLTAGLQASLDQSRDDQSQLLGLLHDKTPAPESELPRTGLTLEREHLLSPIFISMPGYGTRASNIVRIRQESIEFTEQTWDASGASHTVHMGFPIAR